MSTIKKATREGYGEGLKQLGEINDKVVVLDADLAGATKTSTFQKAFPERHFDCGIQEANMIDVAAGLSTLGLVPYASSFAMFAAGRAFEMIRNTIGYPHLNVKVCATHGGITVGEDGASHQCNEDFALMRSIPGMMVLCPADYVEAVEITKAISEIDGPVYVRYSRAATPIIHEETYEFQPGKAELLKDGSDLTIIANGITVPYALEAAGQLEDDGISARVLNMATLKPLDAEAIEKAARETGRILTVEEHTIFGGLGEGVAAVVAETFPVPVKRVGIQDKFGHSGPADALLHEFGLDAEGIYKQAKAFAK